MVFVFLLQNLLFFFSVFYFLQFLLTSGLFSLLPHTSSICMKSCFLEASNFRFCLLYFRHEYTSFSSHFRFIITRFSPRDISGTWCSIHHPFLMLLRQPLFPLVLSLIVSKIYDGDTWNSQFIIDTLVWNCRPLSRLITLLHSLSACDLSEKYYHALVTTDDLWIFNGIYWVHKNRQYIQLQCYSNLHLEFIYIAHSKSLLLFASRCLISASNIAFFHVLLTVTYDIQIMTQ
jgi:hypothetical protein